MLLQARFRRCSDLTTFGTDIREENKTRDEVAVSTEVEMRPTGEQLKVSSKT